jgi:hypothetical protein
VSSRNSFQPIKVEVRSRNFSPGNLSLGILAEDLGRISATVLIVFYVSIFARVEHLRTDVEGSLGVAEGAEGGAKPLGD